jgi:localization factor PodJL
MHNLAVLSAGPQNANPDYATASKWFTDAAERGLADSQYNLAVLYDNGLGVTKDPSQAYKWFALAARSGDKESIRRRDQLALSFSADQAQAAELLVTGFRSRPTDLKANDPRAAAAAFAEKQEQLATQAAQQRQPAAEPTATAEPRKPTPKIVSRTLTKAN